MNYDLYWVWLSCGLGAGASCRNLVTEFDWNPYLIYGSTFNEIYSLNLNTRKQVEKLKSTPLEKAEEILRISAQNGWKIVTPSSEYYPERLLELQDLPLVLYVNGDETILNNELSISVVGARKASDYGQAVARAISASLASKGFTVVSGGALGIDSSAHNGALDENGKTVCVLGCGLGTKYLMENEELRNKIVKSGAVITEYPPFQKPTRESFPLRNRVISGLSLGTVVVEAGERSGSLITARLAGEQGRDVFAVPGDLVTSSFAGTNALIRDGAKMVLSINDIFEEYYGQYQDKLNNITHLPDDEIIRRAQIYLNENKNETAPLKPKKAVTEIKTVKKETPSYLTENARKIYACIGENPVHVDEIINKCGLSTENALSALTELEIYGLVTQMSGRRYKIG